MIPSKLIAEINRWITEKKYGNIQINFVAGKIVNLNRIESMKVEMLMTNSNDTKCEAKHLSSVDL